MSVILASVVPPLPLLPHVAVQALGLAYVRRRGSSSHPARLCAAPLLAHPTMQARMAALHQAMQMLSMPGRWLIGWVGGREID